MEIVLYRTEETEQATRGVVRVNGKNECVFLELSWQDNRKNISCIPAGTYSLVAWDSPRFGKTLLVENVPNREFILIHSGNTVTDTSGCILLGASFGELESKPAVLNSAKTTKAFTQKVYDALANQKATLTIREVAYV